LFNAATCPGQAGGVRRKYYGLDVNAIKIDTTKIIIKNILKKFVQINNFNILIK